MKLKLVYIIASIVTAIGLGVLQSQTSLTTFSSNHMSFKHPKSFISQQLAKRVGRNEQLVKLSRQKSISVIELYRENGAIVAANATKQPLLNIMESGSDKILPKQYPSFSKTSSERIKISGHDMTKINFTYIGKDTRTKLYATLFLTPYQNDGYYLTVQSVDQNQQKSDVSTIQKSLQLY